MVLPTIIATALVRVVASGGPIIIVASSPADHIVVILRLASVAEAVVHRGPFRGVLTPSRHGDLGLLYHGNLEKVSELTANPSPLHGRGLGHCPD